jgi:hypothetical protein
MKFRLSHHVQQELKRRGIPIGLLRQVLNHPQQVVPAGQGRNVYQSQLDVGGG